MLFHDMNRLDTHVLLCLLVFVTATKAQCNDNAVVGPDITIARDETDSGDVTDEAYLVLEDVFTCHGAVKAWRFEWTMIPLPLSCHDVRFMVWRPRGTEYILVGETLFDPGPYGIGTNCKLVDNIDVHEINLPQLWHIPIQPGDVYGWVVEGNIGSIQRLRFESALPGSGLYDKVLVLPSGSGCNFTVGSSCSWAGSRLTARDYSINAILTERPDPIITNLPGGSKVSLKEESGPGKFIYTVIGSNAFNYNDVVDPDMTYDITADTCTAFSIKDTTGVITTIASVDYEALVNNNPPYQCDITVTVREGPYVSASRLLNVSIEDVNEPHTIKPVPDYTVDMATVPFAWAGFRVTLDDIDKDPSNWPNKTFWMTVDPSPAPFTIIRDMMTPPEEECQGEVTSLGHFNEYWLGPDRFTLSIYAADDRHVAGPETVVINIINIREPPIFDFQPTNAFILDGSIGPDCVCKMVGTATPSPDRTDIVGYKITAVYPKTASGYFYIDAQTSADEICYMATDGFDYFGTNPFTVEVVAFYTDGPLQESDKKNLTVHITWINQPPVHQRPYHRTVSINEREPAGTVLPGIVLDATDRDVPGGDWIHYWPDGVGAHLFIANNMTRKITTSQEIFLVPNEDYELYNLTIWVKDSHGETNTSFLDVKVMDVNDHVPVFDKDPYPRGTVKANKPGGTPIGVQVTATDDDGPRNANLKYGILEPRANLYFQVDQAGVVTTKQPIYHPDFTEMTFTVVVTDQGEPVALNSTTTVCVNITDTNVWNPYFDPDFISIDLRSDKDLGFVVHTFVAQDNDTDQQHLNYSFATITDYFSDAQSTGGEARISVSRKLVSYRKHLLYIRAFDDTRMQSLSPYIIRIDTYKAQETLVDIYLHTPLDDFLLTRDDFLVAINSSVQPWDVRIESERNNGDKCIVTVYAVESAKPDLIQHQAMDKVFIGEYDLLKKLRTDLKGTPNDQLQGPEFAPWRPYHVQPRYPTWIIDSPGGVALLTILCLLFVAGLITMFVLLAKKYRWCCYKNSGPPMSTKVDPFPKEKDQFALNYIQDQDMVHTYSSSTMPLPPALYPFRSGAPPPPKLAEPRKYGNMTRDGLRVSTNENDPDTRALPPVVGDYDRPLPRHRGGEAA